MNIFLDSNIIIADYYLTKSDTIIFLRNFKKAGLKVFISRITFDEVISNYRKDLNKKILSYNSSVKAINRQINEDLPVFDSEFEDLEISKYSRKLISRLKEFKINISPIPKIQHKQVLARIMERKRPFDQKDNGYKDFLIFHTIIENIRKHNKDIIFVSQDNDFGEDKLHDDLVALNTTSRNIFLRKSVSQINDLELKEVILDSKRQLAFVKDLFADINHQSNYLESVKDFLSANWFEVEPNFLNEYSDLIIDKVDLTEIYLSENDGFISTYNPISEELVIVELIIPAWLSFIFTIKNRDTHLFKDLEGSYEVRFNHEDFNTIVTIESWFLLDFKIQSDVNGTEIIRIESKIKDTYH